jgi:anti-sigma factor RsiW
MNEHPTKQELDEYRRRVLTPAAFLSVHRHVTACPRCAAHCNLPHDLSRDLQDLRGALLDEPDETPYHLSAADVAAYARGTSDEIDSEIAESHLSICPACHSDVEREVQRHAAEGHPAAPVPVKPAASNARRLVGLSLMNGWQPWRVAAVVSGGILLILVTLWLLRSKPVEHKEQVASPANLSSPQGSPAADVTNEAALGKASPDEPASPDAQFVLVLNDGNQKITVDQQGTLAGLERLPSPVQQKISAALQTGKLERSPALDQLASRPSALLSESGNGLPFRLIGPLGQVVRSEQPTFRWRPLAGAQSYTVIVTDADLNEIATSPPLNTTEWRISKPLKDGGIYSWQVTALKEGKQITSPVLPAPQAKFKVIDRATSETLKRAQRAYPDSHLTLGTLYAEAGLLDEAEQELRVLVRNNPRSRIAQRLLQNLKAMRAAQTSPSGRV